MSFLRRFREGFHRQGNSEMVLVPNTIPTENVYTDKPETVSERCINQVNLVASWMSFLGQPRRVNNAVTMSLKGGHVHGTYEWKYNIQMRFDAEAGVFQSKGYLKFYDLHLNEYHRETNLYSRTPQEIYAFLNSLYTEAFRAKKIQEVKQKRKELRRQRV